MLGRRLPYQMGMARQAFRAPGAPQVSLVARFARLYDLLRSLKGYEQDVNWLAEWTPHLGLDGGEDSVGLLLAAAVDGGGSDGERVFRTLLDTVEGDKVLTGMGRHVPRALLTASREEGWEAMERLLLAAQRQEGLRQVILEAVDEAHPGAFRRILQAVLQHDLLRFSSAVRALDVWFGGGWVAGDLRSVRSFLSKLLPLWEAPNLRQAAIEGPDPEAVYLALWCEALEDAPRTVPLAASLLSHPEVDHRFAAAHLLADMSLDVAGDALVAALDDPDLRVVTRALDLLVEPNSVTDASPDLFERLERTYPRFPGRPKELALLLWPWRKQTAHRRTVTNALLSHLGDRPVTRLTSYLQEMDPDRRASVAQRLGATKVWEPAELASLIRMVGDSSYRVREEALKALRNHTLSEEEARSFETYLKRKAPDLRRGVLEALLRRKDPMVLNSAARLLEGDSAQRTAGLELLRRMHEGGRAPGDCAARAASYRDSHPQLSAIEASHLNAILGDSSSPGGPGGGPHVAAQATLTDALGLMDPTKRSHPVPPEARAVEVATLAAIALLHSLDELVHQHRMTPIRCRSRWSSEEEDELLGDTRWIPPPDGDLPAEDDLARLPLREILEEWWSTRKPELRDGDGLEGLRAMLAIEGASHLFKQYERPKAWEIRLVETAFGPRIKELHSIRFPLVVSGLLPWLPRFDLPLGAPDFLLDVLETLLARVPSDALGLPTDEVAWTFRAGRATGCLYRTVEIIRNRRRLAPEQWSDAHHARFWGLLRWLDEPGVAQRQRPGIFASMRPEVVRPTVERYPPRIEDAVPALEAGVATEADLYDLLLGGRTKSHRSGYFDELRIYSGRRLHPLAERCPVLREAVEQCRRRIVEVELARGETPTAATDAALALRFAGGMETMIELLRALGREAFARGYIRSNSRRAVLSHLLRRTFPGEVDTFDRFASAVRAAGIAEGRLVETAVYAPQWAAHVEHALGWPGLAGAVWWVHAHTKDEDWSVEIEVRQAWEAEISEFTALSGQELTDGAVDVQWFIRVYAELGPDRWKRIRQAGKYASSSGGHTRASLFAEAMLGDLDEEALVRRLWDKRHKDSVRALGLLPIAEGSDGSQEVLRRYKTIEEFRRSSRQFGAMRQESEKRAVQIALDNLARTAGYRDPVRLTWAMETRDSADLRDGGVTVQAGETTLVLAMNPEGAAELTVTKNGKRLKSVPAALKKNEAVAALRAREKEVTRQASRIRRSLEQAMIRGDSFTPAELDELLTHPVLTPPLMRLVLIGDEASGYPVPGGRLRDWGERETAICGELRIAHPFDLLERGEWHEWQRECFRAERIQPFKQIFRELYVLTAAERAEKTLCRRYEGHQVNPRQALALLGGRGWVAHAEEGIRKTFHEAGLTARLEVMGLTYSPADVEGLTLETVRFTRRTEWEALPLESIPPRIFSEAMRDLDLVVSVAHRSGVDPEASASTVEMRAALLSEMCALLGLDNVRVDGRWASIDGMFGSYSLHLASGVVHRQPGGYVCIVPVHSQHRGRLFLPFADDDPKTAEVLSKALLLARDREIKDPTILEQIRGS